MRPNVLRTMFATAPLTVATYAVATELRGDHPDSYVVKRGDTLWDIAGRFLKRPWLWPEIWQTNPQIKNPHLIYPGDVISLAYLDRVGLQASPRMESPVNAVPLAEVEPFLKDLRVVDSIDDLPHVVGLEEDRLRSSHGQVAYVRGLDGIARASATWWCARRSVTASSTVPATAATCSRAKTSTIAAAMREAGTMWSNWVIPEQEHRIPRLRADDPIHRAR